MRIRGIVAALIAGVALILFMGLGHALALTWVDQSPSYLGHDNSLTAVSAVSTTDVYAVGWQCNACTYDSPLLYHYDGTSWSTQSITEPSGVVSFIPNAVLAFGDSGIWVAGDYFDTNNSKREPLVEKWNGSSWIVKYDPIDTGSTQLYAISGSSNTDVWVAGYTNGNGSVLLSHWDGTSFTDASSLPSLSGSDFRLYGLASASSSDVMTVGTYLDTNSHGKNIAWHYNGTSWSGTGPNQPSSTDNELRAVTSIPGTSSHYLAVGQEDDSLLGTQTLAESYNGSSWTTLSTQNQGNGPILFGVSAVGSGNIWAVGSDVRTNHDLYDETLIERYNGSSWSLETSVSPGGDLDNSDLRAVIAYDSSDVWAVGGYDDPNHADHARSLVEFGS